MVGKRLDYSSVPTAPELENNSNQKKYTVNKHPKGNISISKPACAVFVMAALLLAALAAVITYFLVPNCDGHSLPESLTKLDLNEKIAEEPPINYVRLPRSIQPTHYRLFISPEFEGNFTTKGNVTITLKIIEKTNTIRLNALELIIEEKSTKVFKLNQDNKPIKINKQIGDESEQAYTVYLNEYLNENEEYKLFIKFEGFLNDYMVGFYKSSYIDDKNNIRWLASTQFSPTDARRAFPCFDELDFKAKFQINVGRTADRQSLSNMNIDFITSEGNTIWDHYKETPIMSTYVLAFIVHDFKPLLNVNNFSIWSRDGHRMEGVFAGQIGPDMLNFYQNYFNEPYPLKKLDVVALPDFGFSAMENFGLITFRESKLLYNNKTSTTENQRDIALILAHELAHQWFGNLVTPKWWDDLWIKEGFATFFQYLAVDKVFQNWNIMDEFYQCQTLEAFKIDKFISSRPIHFHIQNSNDIRQAFDQISYQKGASLIRMLYHFLDENTFNDGLREFIKTYLYSNANNEDLWKILTEKAHKNRVLDQDKSVDEIMKTWMIQAGYPVITVEKNQNQLILNQKRFLINQESKLTSEKWWIPINYVSNLNDFSLKNNEKIWLKPNKSYSINNFNQTNWYLLNVNQAGYFIVNYDKENWNKLSENIMYFAPGIRAQLISDSMDLARAGLLNYNISLNMMTTIGREDTEINYVHLMAIFDKTNYLHDVLRSTSIYGYFEIFFLNTFNYAFETVTFDEIPADNYLRKRIRSLILKQACRKSDSRCTVDARIRYRAWMDSGREIASPNEREIIYCTSIREGGYSEWKAAYDAYLQANSSSDKLILLKSLGCSSEPWLLARLLEMTISKNSTIRKQDGAEVFRSIARNFHGHSLAFDFIRNRWDEINQYYGVAFRAVSKMVEDLSTFMHSEFQLQQLELFKKQNKYNLKATGQAFDNTIEQVKANIAWMKTNYESVSDWLKEQLQYIIEIK